MPELLTTVEVDVGALHLNERNPRRISEERFEALKLSVSADPEMLLARPIIALPDGTIVGGNMRYRAAVDLGWKTIPVVYADLDEDRAKTWMFRDNRPYGEDDDDLTAELLYELEQSQRDLLPLTGFADEDLERLLASVRGAQVFPQDPDAVPPLPEEPKSKPGEVYELGPHRLMCGDACDKEAVSTLLTGSVPVAVMVTDPPYGVSVDHTWRNGLRPGNARTGRVANDDQFDWEAAYLLTDAPVAYVWHSALYAGEVKAGLAAAGFEVRQQIVWVKKVHALGRAAYQWKHETCWYAVRRGETARWNGGRKQTTVWEAASPIMAYGGGQDDQRTPHPTQKPLAVIEPAIANHTVPGDVVYDPFAGSGTTLIAAEMLGRVCLAMELDPVYCDVIRQRYADFTEQPQYAP